jgi:NTE family protein
MAFNPFGHRNFFDSRVVNPARNPWVQQWLRPLRAEELAFYGTEGLRRTLERHVDFAAINAKDGAGERHGPRLSLGAARVTTGEVVFFENESDEPGEPARAIRADHVLASGALPPAFPPIRIKDPEVDDQLADDDALYWDGGVSSNTPIEWLVHDVLPRKGERDTIVFLVDVWDRKGRIPESMDEACWRQKSIQYGSRKDAARRAIRERQLELLLAGQEASTARLEVYQVMYERSDADGPQFAFADADFSRSTYDRMFRHGFTDMEAALESPTKVRVDTRFEHARAVLYRYGTHHKHRRTDRVLDPVQ